MYRETGAGRPPTLTRLMGAGLLLLMLVASTGGLTHAASSGNTLNRVGTRPAAPHAAPVQPGHRGPRTQHPALGAPAAARPAPAALPAPESCLLKGTVMPSPNTGTSDNNLNEVTALSISNLWSVGTFYNQDSATYQTLVEHWTTIDTGWSVVPSPNVGTGNNQLYAIAAVSATDLWAAGYDYRDGNPGYDETLIEHWDGSTWAVVPSANLSSGNNDLYGISAVSKEDVWAVGGYYDAQTGTTQTLVEHWDGLAWSVVPSPNMAPGVSVLYGVDAITATDVWAVGEFYNTVDFKYAPLIEHWNGTAWAMVPSLTLNANDRYLDKVTAVSATDVWAVGSTWDTSSIDRTLIEHWNGTAWTMVPSANLGTGSNNLYTISAVSATDVWAAGDYYNDVTDAYQTLVEHWNGLAWTPVASPNQGSIDNDLYGIAAISSKSVWVVGTYTQWGEAPLGSMTRTFTALYSPTCPLPNTTPPNNSTASKR